MKLVGRVPVEPLDDERVTNLERRIVARAGDRIAAPERSSRRALGLAIATCAAATIAIVGWKLGQRSVVTPAVAVDVVKVDTTGERSTLALGDATITSEPATTFDVARAGNDLTIALAHGKLGLAVDHREGRLVVVRAGDTEIEDVGTKFSVDYDGARGVVVEVTEGKVKVTRDRRSELVAAGSAWRSGEVLALAELHAAPTSGNPHAAPASASHDADGANIVVDDPASGDRNPGHHVVAPLPDPAKHGPSTATAMAKPAADAAGPHAAKADPYVDLRTAIRTQPLEPALDVGTSDPAKQIDELIRRSSETHGAEASQVFYSLAAVQHQRGRDSDALRAVDNYLRRFAGKREFPEYKAVLWLRLRIQCLRAIDDGCRNAAFSYQHEDPTGPAADVAIRITNAQ